MTTIEGMPFMFQDIRARPLMGITALVHDPRHPGTVRLMLSGELCPGSAAQFEQMIDEVISDGATTICLNLVDLDLCTAAGVDVIERTQGRLEALGGTLRVVGAGGVVRRVLDITGIPIDN